MLARRQLLLLLCNAVPVVGAAAAAWGGLFPASSSASFRTTTTNAEQQHQQEQSDNKKNLQRWFTSAALVATVTLGIGGGGGGGGGDSSLLHLQLPPAAVAKEMASGSGSRVNKDPESLLRYGLPIPNDKEIRKLQVSLEDIKLDIGSKRKSAALDGVKKSKSLLGPKQADKFIAACRQPNVCQAEIGKLLDGLDPLREALGDSLGAFQGSEQERNALDRAYAAQKKAVNSLTTIEEQMIPKGYVTPVPDDYSDLPQLKGGRATVEMVFKKADPNDRFELPGTGIPPSATCKLTMIVDGYTAPVTSGNFVDLVKKGFYDKMPIQRSDGFVVQTGDPEGEADGYVGKGGKALGNGPHGERLIPLEVYVRGDAGPFYESTMEDEGRGGQATVLPFSSFGALGWAREEYEPNSGSSQFFWLLFDSDLTPAGKNVLDGRYPCFGYVVEGADYLGDIKEGDVIVSAKVTKGLENLVPGAE